uniref:Neurotransmitter-gated ion-channel ligand-binding domain-containing protein n=1 Tax=Parascaris univalens TaxID=6257 RepID=A0A915ABI5_PARUN
RVSMWLSPILLTILQLFTIGSSSDDEMRLYNDLLTNYNALERPIWKDYKLKWDPEEYGGIKDVRFPGGADQIWRPDILLYN